jgi:hypothetical protein
MAKKKDYFEHHPDWSIVNKDGEVIKQGVVTKTCKTTEEFVKIYLNAIDEMMKLDHRTFQTLMVCFKTCTYANEDNKEGSIVTNNSIFKDLCREAIGKDKNGKPLSDDAVNNYISRLAKMNILQRYKCRGMYIINPALFIKGHIPQEVRIKAPQNIEPNNNFDSSTNTPC